jgi:hypothetical protein
MEKKQFIALLYIFGIVPMIYTISNNFLPSLWRVGFWGLNILTLIVFAIVFTPNNTPITSQKKQTSFIIIVSLIVIGTTIGGLIKFSNQASLRLYNTAIAPSSTGEIATSWTNTFTWSTGDAVAITLKTGDIDINTFNTERETTQPNYIKSTTTPETASGDTFQKLDNNPTTTESSTITTILPNKGTLSYAQIIPYLVSEYKLKSSGKSVSFKNITSNNALYKSFSIAASKGMIGSDINPASKVSCNTYLVLKGIAAGWKVEYKAGDPFGPYRTAAFNKWQVNGCVAGAFVTKATL